MKTCIWCKTESTKIAVEHIIPDALGCPPDLVLSDGEVCESCNNRLGHLDQAVAEEFDFMAFEENIPRKGGRPPAILSRGNVVATKGPAGSEMSFNMERYPVRAHDGSVLGARGKSRRNVNATFERDGPFARISFEIEFGQGPKFVRGLTKNCPFRIHLLHGCGKGAFIRI